MKKLPRLFSTPIASAPTETSIRKGNIMRVSVTATARSSGAKVVPSVTAPRAMASMEAESVVVLPPRRPRMTRAVASRMSRMLTLRRRLRRAYWLQNSMAREKRIAL